MKLKISGKEYDLDAGASKATLQTLLVMQRDYGVNMADLAVKAERFKDVKDASEMLRNPDLLEALLILIWMARRYAGENVTLEESGSFPINEMEFVAEEGDGQEPDPKEQTGSAPDVAPPAVPATTSKTSKRRSTKTSPTSATTGQG